MATIESVRFDDRSPDKIKNLEYGSNWPVVYIINNSREAYIGETVNAAVRAGQHLKNDDRRRLTTISLIGDNKFNKSVILDLENYLIRFMSADGVFELQNSNMGNQPHNYYQQEEYEKNFIEIWNELRKMNLAQNSINHIQNSDIFKYSPYKNLNLDQYKALDTIVECLVDSELKNKNSTIIVNGGAGTGKTVMAVYLMKLFAEIGKGTYEKDIEMDPGYTYIIENLEKLKKLKIGFVVPMQSLRATIKKVFKNIKDLNVKMVISPVQVPNDYYDLLIVDEAHRLRQRKALAQYPVFDKNNRKLGFDNSGTELDWIMKCSRNQILFYDSMQSVKPSDIDKDVFLDLMKKEGTHTVVLESQFRCAGGNDYIRYVKEIFSDIPPVESRSFDNYEFLLFENVEEMIQQIKSKEKEFGLCRTVAGYSWKWVSKNNAEAYDIEIQGNHYKWNTVNKDWVNSENSINEIGCIHTIQGYDLNYAGVILGNEIKYDPETGAIYVDKSEYYDMQGKTALKNEDSLKEYILNIYKTMFTRGIKGTYVYACDKELREYLKKYINCKVKL